MIKLQPDPAALVEKWRSYARIYRDSDYPRINSADAFDEAADALQWMLDTQAEMKTLDDALVSRVAFAIRTAIEKIGWPLTDADFSEIAKAALKSSVGD